MVRRQANFPYVFPGRLNRKRRNSSAGAQRVSLLLRSRRGLALARTARAAQSVFVTFSSGLTGFLKMEVDALQEIPGALQMCPAVGLFRVAALGAADPAPAA